MVGRVGFEPTVKGLFDVWEKRQAEGGGTHQRWPSRDRWRVQWFIMVDQATTGRRFEK
jgi:hypothetical protein